MPRGTYLYRIGPEPDDARCRTIWCYGDHGVPWTCAACGQPITSDPKRLAGGQLRQADDRVTDGPDGAAALKPESDRSTPTPLLRARNDRGYIIDDPSADKILQLLADLGPTNKFLVIDRLDAPDGDRYAQARVRANGIWVVEYRDGGPDRHYQALTTDRNLVGSVLVGWALQLDGWRRLLTWRLVIQ